MRSHIPTQRAPQTMLLPIIRRVVACTHWQTGAWDDSKLHFPRFAVTHLAEMRSSPTEEICHVAAVAALILDVGHTVPIHGALCSLCLVGVGAHVADTVLCYLGLLLLCDLALAPTAIVWALALGTHVIHKVTKKLVCGLLVKLWSRLGLLHVVIFLLPPPSSEYGCRQWLGILLGLALKGHCCHTLIQLLERRHKVIQLGVCHPLSALATSCSSRVDLATGLGARRVDVLPGTLYVHHVLALQLDRVLVVQTDVALVVLDQLLPLPLLLRLLPLRHHLPGYLLVAEQSLLTPLALLSLLGQKLLDQLQ
eukprot:comp18485_c0_seq1/m.19856 comp18485_c0_seq1/g.19856  ORF comp18485_c0_seq1/g.19856 comp18485_c0_seq1/m.19856 type:complete len:309 (+) comp18485_c0_seq1:707-1633(+)